MHAGEQHTSRYKLACCAVLCCGASVLLLLPVGVLQLKDPMLAHLEGPLLVPPEAIIALALGSLYASFVCFAQSVR